MQLGLLVPAPLGCGIGSAREVGLEGAEYRSVRADAVDPDPLGGMIEAIARVSWMTAPFDAQYAAAFAAATSPSCEATLTMAASPERRRCGSAARAVR